MRVRPPTSWKRWLLILSIPVVVVVVALLVFQDGLIYFPRQYAADAMSALPPRTSALPYQTDQGKQTAFYCAAKGDGVPEHLWLLFGGNASLALDWSDFVSRYPDDHTAFLLIDYPGYGRCEGAPSPARIAAASDAAFIALANRLTLTPEALAARSGVLGHSLGAAAACQFAARHPLSRVVLVSPFTELRAMARRTVGWPLCWLLRGNFDNRARLAEIVARDPALHVEIFHGDQDEVIPVAMGRTLGSELGDRATYHEISGGDHNGILELAESAIHAVMLKPR